MEAKVAGAEVMNDLHLGMFSFDDNTALMGMAIFGGRTRISRLNRHALTPEENDAINTTLEQIRKGNTNGLHVHTFNNSKSQLPNTKGVTYTSYDVSPSPGSTNRGTRRLVYGSDGSIYYTNTHYGDTGGIPFFQIR